MSRQNGKHDAIERVTIQEASRRLGKSEKTIRRWVHTGKLRPETIEGKFMFAVSELHDILEAEKPGPTVEERMTALEERVSDLQATLDEMKAKLDELSAGRKPYQHKQPPLRILRESLRTEGEGAGLVKAMDFAELHHVSEEAARAAFKRQTIKTTKPPGQQSHYLTPEQQRQAVDYWEVHHTPNFIRCAECPHG